VSTTAPLVRAPADAQHARVSVVIAVTQPTMHAAELVHAYSRALADSGHPFEFVFVLDGIGGPVERELDELRARHPVQIVRLQGGGLGESIALSAGVDAASGEFVLNVPAYLQSEPDDLRQVLQALESGAEFVATWRHPRVDPWLNQLQSRFFNWFLRVLMGIRFHDLNSSVRGMRRHVLDEVNVYGDLYRFLPVLAHRRGFRVVEVKVRHREEKGRAGFYGIGVYLRRLLDILAITFLTRFTQKPLRFFGMLGLVSLVVGLALVAGPLWEKFFGEGGILQRPVFVLGVILIAFAVQLVGFGLVGEIIIFTQARNLREYRIAEVVRGGGGGPGGSGGPGSPAGGDTGGEPPGGPQDPGGRGTGGTQEPGRSEPAGRRPEPACPQAPRPSREPGRRDPSGGASEGATTLARHGDGASPRVRELLPGEDARWDEWVRRHPQRTFFHLTGWRRVVEDQFGHAPHYLVAERGREWAGILPLFFVKSRFTGKNLVSIPYAVYGGALVGGPGDESVLTSLHAAAAQLGSSLGARYVELRQLEPRPGTRPHSDLYVTFRKSLPRDPAAVLPQIPKKARAEVRRARDRFGITFGDSKDLDEFFALFASNKRRLGSPSLPRRWFSALRDEFGDRAVLHVARDPSGLALAGVMSFHLEDTVYAYYSGSRPEANHKGVNDFIYCKLMEWCVERGYRVFDFGRSRKDSGPAAFKRNMGFLPMPLHYEYLLTDARAKLPAFHPGNPRLRLPQRIWSRLPLFVTVRLGAYLSKSIP
jgi:FemAB-related protein (PEP-CTERM system-associated)